MARGTTPDNMPKPLGAHIPGIDPYIGNNPPTAIGDARIASSRVASHSDFVGLKTNGSIKIDPGFASEWTTRNAALGGDVASPIFQRLQNSAASFRTYVGTLQGEMTIAGLRRVHNHITTWDFTDAAWNKWSGGTGSTPIVTMDYADGPGAVANGAARVQFDKGAGGLGSDGSQLRYNSPLDGATDPFDKSCSLWVKVNSGGSTTFRVWSTATFSQYTLEEADGWVRVSAGGNADTQTQWRCWIGLASTTSQTADLLIATCPGYGPTLEVWQPGFWNGEPPLPSEPVDPDTTSVGDQVPGGGVCTYTGASGIVCQYPTIHPNVIGSADERVYDNHYTRTNIVNAVQTNSGAGDYSLRIDRWSDNGTSGAPTAAPSVPDPDGGSNTYLVPASDASGYLTITQFEDDDPVSLAGRTFVFSYWVKAVDAADVGKMVDINIYDGGHNRSQYPLPSNWTRVAKVITCSTDAMNVYIFDRRGGGDAEQMYVYGAQVEEIKEGDLPFPSPFFPSDDSISNGENIPGGGTVDDYSEDATVAAIPRSRYSNLSSLGFVAEGDNYVVQSLAIDAVQEVNSGTATDEGDGVYLLENMKTGSSSAEKIRFVALSGTDVENRRFIARAEVKGEAGEVISYNIKRGSGGTIASGLWKNLTLNGEWQTIHTDSATGLTSNVGMALIFRDSADTTADVYRVRRYMVEETTGLPFDSFSKYVEPGATAIQPNIVSQESPWYIPDRSQWGLVVPEARTNLADFDNLTASGHSDFSRDTTIENAYSGVRPGGVWKYTVGTAGSSQRRAIYNTGDINGSYRLRAVVKPFGDWGTDDFRLGFRGFFEGTGSAADVTWKFGDETYTVANDAPSDALDPSISGPDAFGFYTIEVGAVNYENAQSLFLQMYASNGGIYIDTPPADTGFYIADWQIISRDQRIVFPIITTTASASRDTLVAYTAEGWSDVAQDDKATAVCAWFQDHQFQNHSPRIIGSAGYQGFGLVTDYAGDDTLRLWTGSTGYNVQSSIDYRNSDTVSQLRAAIFVDQSNEIRDSLNGSSVGNISVTSFAFSFANFAIGHGSGPGDSHAEVPFQEFAVISGGVTDAELQKLSA